MLDRQPIFIAKLLKGYMKVSPTNTKWPSQDGQTLQEIAISMDLTRERIRQIEGKALTKAKRILLKQGKGPESVI